MRPIELLKSEFYTELNLGGVLPSQMSFKDLLTKARMNTGTVDAKLSMEEINRLEEIYEEAQLREQQSR